MMPNPLARWSAARKLLRAEQQLYDAYAPGGCLAGRPFVLPLDYFSRPPVREAVFAWLAGRRPLDVPTLAGSWMGDHRTGTLDDFHANLLHFVLVVRDPRWYGASGAPAAVWFRRSGDGRLPPL